MSRMSLNGLLRMLTVLVILRVLVLTLTNYPDYFPANFDSLFLQGREQTFFGWYAVAFYLHIITAPLVLVSGLILLSEQVLRRARRLHRLLGWAHAAVLLALMLPSAAVMSRHAFSGWMAGISFMLLSVLTALCTILGIIRASQRQYAAHRRWMLRSYVLICSAVTLRLISGTMSLFDGFSPELAYQIAAWSSWLIPLSLLVATERWHGMRRSLLP
ncbi:DUF2306 domain-containing protein [Tuwongella immobilis]|uniref:DUF2306 domain-containing protein n=1 Tax=Tuwongella immobilis TaxID=692036 RepID=A0A6C2YJ01_9BACT|nr:DUF2306 domain-containing protein [Tuwongella immobilis]VIP01528.1 Uncharacterized protein OS=Planctomyces limnophilus (strain ATCC 43296 / DSM 3776 / IFAM 1008 / 290) GN=Plim_2418 PE=4 SV=1: DUF2306 [Tuwongella immobilis]VTR98676.1 Uncharacterized protein OS=Planctomyces limnophilus (strain ATCC 43296 / DSM 3776 / IFAM 1008 / 290) GN=Plim_2418 PE=4 SV=1: DUF2306 [Tuwongella immobilis]